MLVRLMKKVEAEASNNELEEKLKRQIHELENEILEVTLERDRLTKDERKFADMKKNSQREIERAEADALKCQREMDDLAKEGIPMAEKEVDEKKE